jgi:hypothetical protein
MRPIIITPKSTEIESSIRDLVSILEDNTLPLFDSQIMILNKALILLESLLPSEQ